MSGIASRRRMSDRADDLLTARTLTVDIPTNTYLNPSGFKKGVAFVNGYNLGRYWTVGPQLTLFIPATLLKEGDNVLVMFEAEGHTGSHTVSFDAVPQIDILCRVC